MNVHDPSPTLALAPSPAAGAVADAATLTGPFHLTRILVPTDFSEPAHHALNYAERIARRFHAAVTVLHVFQLPIYTQGSPSYPGPAVRGAHVHRLYVGAMTQANERLKTLRDQLKRGLTDVATEIRTGTPHEQIIGAATDTRADLIVIATYGFTGWKHLLLGSTAERVVRLAPCPVLVVRQDEGDLLPNGF